MKNKRTPRVLEKTAVVAPNPGAAELQGELFVTIKQLADATNMGTRTIATLMRRGAISYIKLKASKQGGVRFNLKKVMGELETKFGHRART